jgi:carnitine-CoA ligase
VDAQSAPGIRAGIMTSQRPDPGMEDRELPLPTLVRQRAEQTPDAVFVTDIGVGSYTYGEIEATARRWACALVAAGVQPGDRVAVAMAGSAAAVIAWLAVAKSGAVEVAVNLEYGAETLLPVLIDCQTRVLVVSMRQLPGLSKVLQEPDSPVAVVLVPDASGRTQLQAPAGVTCLTEADIPPDTSQEAATAATSAPAGGIALPPEQQVHDTACIIFTSGTTGRSKGVAMSWRKLYVAAVATWDAHRLGADDVYYSPAPLFHVSGKSPLYQMAIAGGSVVVRERFSASSYLDDIRKYGCTQGMLLLAMANYLMAQPGSAEDRNNPLRRVCIAPMVADPAAFRDRFDVEVATFYGQTELSLPLVTSWNADVPGSCGRVRPGFQLKIVDEHDAEVPVGSVGELVVRTDRPWMLLTEYVNNPAATAQAWRNGWFHTGDAFRRDGDGNYFFIDRMRDTIRRRGENIASLQLEAAIGKHPAVAECAAIPRPSQWGEDDIVLVVVAPDIPEGGREALAAELRAMLPQYMRPDAIAWLDGLPKTATGKIQKAVLRSSPDLLTAGPPPADLAPGDQPHG